MFKEEQTKSANSITPPRLEVLALAIKENSNVWWTSTTNASKQNRRTEPTPSPLQGQKFSLQGKKQCIMDLPQPIPSNLRRTETASQLITPHKLSFHASRKIAKHPFVSHTTTHLKIYSLQSCNDTRKTQDGQKKLSKKGKSVPGNVESNSPPSYIQFEVLLLLVISLDISSKIDQAVRIMRPITD